MAKAYDVLSEKRELYDAYGHIGIEQMGDEGEEFEIREDLIKIGMVMLQDKSPKKGFTQAGCFASNAWKTKMDKDPKTLPNDHVATKNNVLSILEWIMGFVDPLWGPDEDLLKNEEAKTGAANSHEKSGVNLEDDENVKEAPSNPWWWINIASEDLCSSWCNAWTIIKKQTVVSATSIK